MKRDQHRQMTVYANVTTELQLIVKIAKYGDNTNRKDLSMRLRQLVSDCGHLA